MRYPKNAIELETRTVWVCEFFDPWDDDRESGEWALEVLFDWAPRRGGVSAFRGLRITVGTVAFAIGAMVTDL